MLTAACHTVKGAGSITRGAYMNANTTHHTPLFDHKIMRKNLICLVKGHFIVWDNKPTEDGVALNYYRECCRVAMIWSYDKDCWVEVTK